jgi:hypothetical protein
MSRSRAPTPLSGTLPLGTPHEAPRAVTRATVEVQVHDFHTAPALAANLHRVVEIWTRERVYSLDAQYVCQEVIDLASGQKKPRHLLLGSRLVGGQQGDELTFPVPMPGGEAVFQKLDGKGRARLQITSKVTRVILHVRRVKISVTEQKNAWSQVARTGDGR